MLLRCLPAAAAAVGVERVALEEAAVAPPSANPGPAFGGEARLAFGGARVSTEVRFRPAKKVAYYFRYLIAIGKVGKSLQCSFTPQF